MTRVAIIGAGSWGVNLIRTFARLGNLARVYDASPERAQAEASKYGVKTAGNLSEVFSDNSINAIVIATPAESHYAIASEALRAGKDVFVEKPMTLRAAESERLVELADRRGAILMVGHLLKYHPAIVKLRELVTSGEIGRIEYIYSNRLNLGKVRKEENALWSFAPHDISVIQFLLDDAMPIQVSATAGAYLQPNIADVTVSNLLFDAGVRAHVFVSWLHPFKEQKLVVIGSGAMAVFDDLAEAKLVKFSKDIQLKDGQFIVRKPAGQVVQYDNVEPLERECQHFLDCIDRRQNPITDGRDGLRVIQVLQACQRSLELNGAPVQPSDVRVNAVQIPREQPSGASLFRT